MIVGIAIILYRRQTDRRLTPTRSNDPDTQKNAYYRFGKTHGLLCNLEM
jgi:hypothetical protein